MKNAPIILAFLVGAGLLLMSRKTWAIPAKGMTYFPFFSQAEYQYGLPSRLLARVAYQESRFSPEAFNAGSGARGMMQIVPKWHPGVNVTDLDPVDDIFYAAKYLKENFDRFGSWAKALAAYNWGPTALSGALTNYGTNWLAYTPKETQNYVRDITGDLGLSLS